VHKNHRAAVRGIVAIITCAGRARGLLPSLVGIPPIPPVSHGPGALYQGKGLRTMNTVYAMIYIVATAAVVTVAFLVVTALTS